MDVHTESASRESEVGTGVRRPTADLAVSPHEWRLWVELPGVEPAAVEVRLDPAGLTVMARARRPVMSETRPLLALDPLGAKLTHALPTGVCATGAEPTARGLSEFPVAAQFQRQFPLGEQWDRSAMSVEVAHGVLMVRLPVRPDGASQACSASGDSNSAGFGSASATPGPTQRAGPIRIPVRTV